jgi:hypothetical protein
MTEKWTPVQFSLVFWRFRQPMLIERELWDWHSGYTLVGYGQSMR